MSKKNHFLKEILGEESTSFIEIFKKNWKSHLKSFPDKYSKGEQFIIGARFRPVLVCWGYVLTNNDFDLKKRKELSNLSLHIELLHKATLLIDDLIDMDDFRHGKKSFHYQFTENEAILFAIYLLGDSFEQLSKSLRNSINNNDYFDIINLFTATIKEMTLGALNEVNLSNGHPNSIKSIKKIIENQTISIIKNGLLIGYKYGNGNQLLENVIDNIGYDCGYIFQLLNDLEPFGNANFNKEHKGTNNIDALNSRKNLIIAFIVNSLSKKETIYFNNMLINKEKNNKEKLSIVIEYYNDKNIFKEILSNLNNVRNNLDRNIIKLKENIQNSDLTNDFEYFLNYLMRQAIDRVGLNKNYKKLSDILIR